MEERVAKRDFGLDLVRATAGVLVLSVHFFLNSGFYQAPMLGGTMLLACMVRMVCMTCVPLFLVLTGYSCVHRQWSWGYYRKLVPILLTYLLTCLACLAFRVWGMEEEISLLRAVGMVLNFSAAPYAWYIEMYIGLFLLSPFFNAAWNSLGQRAKLALLVSLAVLTALPSGTNQLGKLLPDWWVSIYPLTYYALGAWLREHPLKAKSWKLLLGFLALAAAMGLKGYLVPQVLSTSGGAYVWMPEDNWSGWSLTIQAALLFSLLVRFHAAPRPVAWLVGRVAKLSLGMYLVSYIADQLVYPHLIAAVPAAHQRLWWMPLAVLAVVTLSCLMAQAIDWTRQGLTWCINKLCPRAKLK